MEPTEGFATASAGSRQRRETPDPLFIPANIAAYIMEPPLGIEPRTYCLPACRSPLPAKALACEAGGWSRREESNPQPIVYKTIALPLSYSGAWATGRQAKHLLFRKRSSVQKSEVRPKLRPEKLLKRRRRPRLWKF